MSKYVSVPNGNYTVKTQSGGTIRLDTGVGAGETRVTGDDNTLIGTDDDFTEDA